MRPTSIDEDLVSPGVSFEPAMVDALLEHRASPGILVLAPPMRLIHMNGTSWDMIRDIPEAEYVEGQSRPRLAKGLLPPSLRQICIDLFLHLRERPHAKDWERFEIKRLVGVPRRPILVRGFGVPDQSRSSQSRIVLLMEEIGRRPEGFSQDLAQRFQLTGREQTVIECLAKGWTNKEIAAALRLALPTVKEHIRHIMDKTKTNTRTGILVQVFRM